MIGNYPPPEKPLNFFTEIFFGNLVPRKKKVRVFWEKCTPDFFFEFGLIFGFVPPVLAGGGAILGANGGLPYNGLIKELWVSV